MGVVARRFDVALVRLEPTVGNEIRKSRPCVVLSPNDMNSSMSTLIVAPMTTKGRDYSWRVPCSFDGKQGWIALDQIRTIDRRRVVQTLGVIEGDVAKRMLRVVAEMFAP